MGISFVLGGDRRDSLWVSRGIGRETYTLEHPLVVFSHPSRVAGPEFDEIFLFVSGCGAENGLLLLRTEDGESGGTGRQGGGEEGGVLHYRGAI